MTLLIKTLIRSKSTGEDAYNDNSYGGFSFTVIYYYK